MPEILSIPVIPPGLRQLSINIPAHRHLRNWATVHLEEGGRKHRAARVLGRTNAHTRRVPEGFWTHTRRVPQREFGHTHTPRVPQREFGHTHPLRVPQREFGHTHTPRVPQREFGLGEPLYHLVPAQPA